MAKLKRFEQAFQLMQPVLGSLKDLAPSMLGAKMEGSLSFLASLVRNALQKKRFFKILQGP